MRELWVEKYRPSKLTDYVFRDQSQKDQVASWLKSGAIPHLLFSGSAGTGKTTLAKILIEELGVDWGDVLFMNGTTNNSINEVRAKVTNFATTMGFGEFRYIIIDEADYLSRDAQAALRGVTELYADNCRFILTCNYKHKIIPALHSRMQGFHIEKLDSAEFTARVATIMITEGVEFSLDTLDIYVASTYPDMRKCINLCQQNSQSGTLLEPGNGESNERDYQLEMVALFRQGKYKEARTLICDQIGQEEYDEVFRFMYDNLDFWADSAQKENAAIIIIRNGLVSHTSCGDPEINLSATFCELEMLAQE